MTHSPSHIPQNTHNVDKLEGELEVPNYTSKSEMSIPLVPNLKFNDFSTTTTIHRLHFNLGSRPSLRYKTRYEVTEPYP